LKLRNISALQEQGIMITKTVMMTKTITKTMTMTMTLREGRWHRDRLAVEVVLRQAGRVTGRLKENKVES
jgi:hypothetical protein